MESECVKDAGINRVGENRVQEAMQKMDEVDSVDFDLIGHLQSNKAKQAVGRFFPVYKALTR